MLYRPGNASLWDTTLIHDGERYHLFHIDGNGLGHAVSTDLAHWTEHEPFALKGPPGSWNEGGAYLTGDIVWHDGRWNLFAGAHVPDSPTPYGLFTSTDLEHWTAHPDNPVLRPAGPHYRETPLPAHDMLAAWRDPALYTFDDGHFHAVLCARGPRSHADDTGALIGHTRSRDLIHWEHLAPLAHVGERVLFAEVPGWFTLNGRHYLYFLDLGWGGTRVHSPRQGDDLTGTFYLRADAFDGPYHWPEAPLLIGSRDARMGPWAARVLREENRLLLYHHISAAQPAFAAPKEIREVAPGRLGLRYLPILDKLAEGPVLDTARAAPALIPRRNDAGHWQLDAGTVRGRALAVGSSVALTPASVSDVIAEAAITVEAGAAAGLLLRASSREPDNPFAEGADRALAAVLDVERQQVALREVSEQPGHGWGHTWRQARAIDPRPGPGQRTPCPLEHGRAYHLRVLLREGFAELYLDGWWLLSANVETTGPGRLECFVERAAAAFSPLKVRSLPPLA